MSPSGVRMATATYAVPAARMCVGKRNQASGIKIAASTATKSSIVSTAGQSTLDQSAPKARLRSWPPVGIEEPWLQAKLDAHRQSRNGHPKIGANAGRPDSAGRKQRGVARNQVVCAVADDWQDHGHVEAVGEDGQNAAVAEEQRLD